MSDEIVKADDGGLANVVGRWAGEKHLRLAHYVGIASGVRKGFIGPRNAGASYIDPYCAMGRAKIREQERFIDGSSVAAWKEAAKKGAPFTEVHIADLNPIAVEQNSQRLRQLGAPVHTYKGAAEEVVSTICSALNPHGLHFAFLDPYNLNALPFEIIQQLCAFKRMDVLIHVSSHDLQRNFERYLAGETEVLDRFSPGWKAAVTHNASAMRQRSEVFQHWLNLIKKAGKVPAEGIEHITGSRNQTLYWLVLVSAHKLAGDFWDKIRNVGGQGDLF